MLGLSLPPSLWVMCLYFQRLVLHKSEFLRTAALNLADPPRAVPTSAMTISAFLPIGPCGQSAFVFLQLALVLRKLQAETGIGIGGGGSLSRAEHEIVTLAIYGVSIVLALFMWGLGLFWLSIASTLAISRGLRKGFPFNLGWWCVFSRCADFGSTKLMMDFGVQGIDVPYRYDGNFELFALEDARD